MKLKIIYILALLFVVNCDSHTCYSTEVVLKWDANIESYLAGYNIYIKEGSFVEQDDSRAIKIKIPLSTSGFSPWDPCFTVTDLVDGTLYFFVVTAYSQNGDESEFSNQIKIKAEELSDEHRSTSTGSESGCLISSLTFNSSSTFENCVRY
jgi:hypothetical protein